MVAYSPVVRDSVPVHFIGNAGDGFRAGNHCATTLDAGRPADAYYLRLPVLFPRQKNPEAQCLGVLLSTALLQQLVHDDLSEEYGAG